MSLRRNMVFLNIRKKHFILNGAAQLFDAGLSSHICWYSTCMESSRVDTSVREVFGCHWCSSCKTSVDTVVLHWSYSLGHIYCYLHSSCLANSTLFICSFAKHWLTEPSNLFPISFFLLKFKWTRVLTVFLYFTRNCCHLYWDYKEFNRPVFMLIYWSALKRHLFEFNGYHGDVLALWLSFLRFCQFPTLPYISSNVEIQPYYTQTNVLHPPFPDYSNYDYKILSQCNN